MELMTGKWKDGMWVVWMASLLEFQMDHSLVTKSGVMKEMMWVDGMDCKLEHCLADCWVERSVHYSETLTVELWDYCSEVRMDYY